MAATKENLRSGKLRVLSEKKAENPFLLSEISNFVKNVPSENLKVEGIKECD